MTSSNCDYIKSVLLLLINLEYISVAIFRGFTEVFKRANSSSHFGKDAMMFNYFQVGSFVLYAFWFVSISQVPFFYSHISVCSMDKCPPTHNKKHHDTTSI